MRPQAILLTAKARALLDGRYNVSFDDIDDVAKAALRHRLALNFDAAVGKCSGRHDHCSIAGGTQWKKNCLMVIFFEA